MHAYSPWPTCWEGFSSQHIAKNEKTDKNARLSDFLFVSVSEKYYKLPILIIKLTHFTPFKLAAGSSPLITEQKYICCSFISTILQKEKLLILINYLLKPRSVTEQPPNSQEALRGFLSGTGRLKVSPWQTSSAGDALPCLLVLQV